MSDDLGQIAQLQPHGGKRVKGVHGDNVTLKMRGNSRAYLIARLRRDGFDELLAGVLDGQISALVGAEMAGIRKRREIRGTGSQNQAKKIAWDVHKLLDSPRPDPKALIG
jgi:hypothetical protein